MIFVYIISCFTFGWCLLQVLDKIHIINLSELLISEKISISMIFGFFSFSLLMFIIAFLNIPFGGYLVVPLYISLAVVFVEILIYHKSLFFIIKKNFNRDNLIKNFWAILFGCILSAIILNFMFIAISNHPRFPDEFSHWATTPKLYFTGKQINTFIPTYLEHYPPFLPLISSGFYFSINEVADNMIRIFPSVFLFSGMFSFIGLSKRRNFNLSYCFILFILVCCFYPDFIQVGTSTYADIPFMILYAFGVLYLLEYLSESCNNKTLLFVSLIFTLCSVWCKTDGLFLYLYTLFFVGFIKICFNKIEKKKIFFEFKPLFIYMILPLVLDFFWRLYQTSHDFPKKVTAMASKVTINFDAFVPMLKAMYTQIYDSGITLVFLFVLLLGLALNYDKFTKKKIFYILSLISFILINVLFLTVCYLTIFGGEGYTAASFVRYCSRLIPIVIVIILEIYKGDTHVKTKNIADYPSIQ